MLRQFIYLLLTMKNDVDLQNDLFSFTLFDLIKYFFLLVYFATEEEDDIPIVVRLNDTKRESRTHECDDWQSGEPRNTRQQSCC